MSDESLHLSESVVVRETTMHDVMTPGPHTVASKVTIADAHALMRRLHCRHLPVVDGGVLVGIVSERDLFVVESLTASDDSLDEVADAMNPRVYVTSPTAKLRDVARVMAAEKYGSAVVMEANRVVGIFTRDRRVSPSLRVSSVVPARLAWRADAAPARSVDDSKG